MTSSAAVPASHAAAHRASRVLVLFPLRVLSGVGPAKAAEPSAFADELDAAPGGSLGVASNDMSSGRPSPFSSK